MLFSVVMFVICVVIVVVFVLLVVDSVCGVGSVKIGLLS